MNGTYYASSNRPGILAVDSIDNWRPERPKALVHRAAIAACAKKHASRRHVAATIHTASRSASVFSGPPGTGIALWAARLAAPRLGMRVPEASSGENSTCRPRSVAAMQTAEPSRSFVSCSG
jgi:hypothetical protein